MSTESAKSAPSGSSIHQTQNLYWRTVDAERAAARSRARAERAAHLLAQAGFHSGRLLEVGCGPGVALDRLRAAGFETVGLEASPDAAAHARERGLRVEIVDVERDALPGGFDVVVALEALEHLRDPLSVLRAMAAATRSGGRIVVSLPNEYHALRRMCILLGASGALSHRQFAGHDDPHLRHFTPRESLRLFRAAGLSVEACAWDGLAPPRPGVVRGALRRVGCLLASLWPSMFSISGIFVLRVDEALRAANGETSRSPKSRVPA